MEDVRRGSCSTLRFPTPNQIRPVILNVTIPATVTSVGAGRQCASRSIDLDHKNMPISTHSDAPMGDQSLARVSPGGNTPPRYRPLRPDTSWKKLFGRFKSMIYRLEAALYSCWLPIWKTTGGRWLFIKACNGAAAAEVAALRYIRQHTDIPVPMVYMQLRWRRAEYIIMERVQGRELAAVWESYDDEEKQVLFAQLRRCVDQLRSLSSPFSNQICSVIAGPVRDGRLLFAKDAGPFPDELHMNRQLHYPDPDSLIPDDPPTLQRAVLTKHRIVFTHGDLAMRNIMVDGRTVTAIVDWESSGWFPEHWEYVKAHFGTFRIPELSFKPWIRRFIPAYDEELEADNYMFSTTWIPVRRVD